MSAAFRRTALAPSSALSRSKDAPRPSRAESASGQAPSTLRVRRLAGLSRAFRRRVQRVSTICENPAAPAVRKSTVAEGGANKEDRR